MPYRLFYTGASSLTDRVPDLHQLAPLEFELLGASINAGCQLIKRGGIVWRIDSLSGFVMERSDIENECNRRSEFSNSPPNCPTEPTGRR